MKSNPKVLAQRRYTLGWIIGVLTLSIFYFNSPVFAQTVVLNEIEYRVDDLVEIKNLGGNTADISSWWLCARFSYAQISNLTVVSGSTNLAPGSIVVLSGFALDNTAADLGLYNSSGFSSTAAMADFVQWREPGTSQPAGRESVAVSKGIWTAADFVPTVADGHSIEYDGDGNASSDWLDQANPTLGSSGTPDVVINELMWAGDAQSASNEWIELRNTTAAAIDLSGWDLTRLSSGNEVRMLTIPNGQTVPAGGFLLISNSDADNSQLAVTPDFVTTDVSLVNNQLQIRLYNGLFDSGGSLIDAADDGIGAPAASENPGTLGRKSMVRNDPPGNGTEASSWHAADRAFGWDAGATELGTPGNDNSLAVELSLFTATFIEAGVILNWKTESETNNLGFWIYRSNQRDGKYVRVNPVIIRGAGTSGTPHTYEFTDADIDGTVYYYYIEDVAFDGATDQSPIIQTRGIIAPTGKHLLPGGKIKGN